jgi:hypothetical protein
MIQSPQSFVQFQNKRPKPIPHTSYTPPSAPSPTRREKLQSFQVGPGINYCSTVLGAEPSDLLSVAPASLPTPPRMTHASMEQFQR